MTDKKRGLRLITNKMLTGACRRQRAIFRREWPEGAPVTVKAALRAVKLGLDMGWLAHRLLPEDLWAEYRRQEVPLWNEYLRQRALLLADEDEQQRTPLWAEYWRQEVRIVVAFLRKVEI